MIWVMSVAEPFGTWQYAHAVWHPAGARVASKRLGCASKTKGRVGCRPSQESVSPCAISSSVAPRCKVAVCRHSGYVHGMGADNAQSILKTPGPYANRDMRLR